MVSFDVALVELETVAQAEPFHFCKYKSKSAPDVGPARQPL